MNFVLKDAVHTPGLTQGSRLLIVLASSGTAPLTSRQIKDLALGAGVRHARNWDISTILGRSPDFVIKTPHGWELTTPGRSHVAGLLGLPSPGGKAQSPRNVARAVGDNSVGSKADLLLITALPDELESAKDAFAPDRAWQLLEREGESYDSWLTPFAVDGGRSILVAATRASGMGMTAAAIRTTQAIVRFQPQVVLMVGIAAGTRSNGRHYGDPLIADPCVDYVSGKIAVDRAKLILHPDPYPIPLEPHVRSTLTAIASEGLFLDQISRSWQGRRPPHQLNAHVGPLGSGDQVINARGPVAEAQRHWRKLIGLEMEVYAVYRATRESRVPQPTFFAVKSVCDFAEGKTDEWQPYARYVASHYARALVHAKWDALTPRST
jgi:nucleoside phosphorylase